MGGPGELCLVACTQPSPTALVPSVQCTHLDDVQLLHTGGHPELGVTLVVQTVCNTEATLTAGAMDTWQPKGSPWVPPLCEDWVRQEWTAPSHPLPGLVTLLVLRLGILHFVHEVIGVPLRDVLGESFLFVRVLWGRKEDFSGD